MYNDNQKTRKNNSTNVRKKSMKTPIDKLVKERKIHQKGKCNQQIKYKKMFNLNAHCKLLFFAD